MENFKLVLPEHLNHYGFLFGGQMLKWVDESAYIAVHMDYPEADFVTVAFREVAFRRRVEQGSILRFVVERTRIGTSSVDYRVEVFKSEDSGEPIFSTVVVFVRVDREGKKLALLPGG
ncbi:MAG: acyl-CoA thioesterase [Deltaproteobacteria bacterium]|nr:acyl-CoA thioesterase [Deltaproteobacteria bacterium]